MSSNNSPVKQEALAESVMRLVRSVPKKQWLDGCDANQPAPHIFADIKRPLINRSEFETRTSVLIEAFLDSC